LYANIYRLVLSSKIYRKKYYLAPSTTSHLLFSPINYQKLLNGPQLPNSYVLAPSVSFCRQSGWKHPNYVVLISPNFENTLPARKKKTQLTYPLTPLLFRLLLLLQTSSIFGKNTTKLSLSVSKSSNLTMHATDNQGSFLNRISICRNQVVSMDENHE
jgi:hypothetical protein